MKDDEKDQARSDQPQPNSIADPRGEDRAGSHPMQPLHVDDEGVIRFKRNRIVNYVLDWCATKNGSAGYNRINASGPAPDLNELSRMDFSAEDWMQLAQLLGYSVSGYGELSYVTDDSYAAAATLADATKASTESSVLNRGSAGEAPPIRGQLRAPSRRFL